MTSHQATIDLSKFLRLLNIHEVMIKEMRSADTGVLLTAAGTETLHYMCMRGASHHDGKMIDKSVFFFHTGEGVRLLWHQEGRSMEACFLFTETCDDKHDY